MKSRTWPFLWCSLALLIGGCPKRQAPPRIVYVRPPSPAAAPAPAGVETGSLVIEEPPPPPEPQPASEAKSTTTQETPPQHHRTVRRPPATTPENATEPAEPPPSPVPSLEPHESFMEQASLRREIQGLQDDVRDRITKLSHSGLSGVDRKTLGDARSFFRQSTQALDDGDLQRALTLARKASLLLSALEH